METSTIPSDFESAYRDHFASIRHFVFQFVQDVAVAEELTQDAFLKALAAWGSYRGEAPERVWLLRIARNVCLDFLRSPRSRGRSALSLDRAGAEGIEPSAESLMAAGREPPLSVEQAALRAEMSDCVQQFVLSLPETLRSPLILHDIQGLTNAEIAQVLSCSVEAAKMRLHRARGLLKQMMEERCDLFHDERNVLACLPAPPETGFVSIEDIGNTAGTM